MKLIVDSGSTKTTWLLLSALREAASEFHTLGINPVRDDEQAVRAVIAEAAGKCGEAARSVTAVYFYGAGCMEPYSGVVRRALGDAFPAVGELSVESDLLGAARALCGHEEGIACILGTGANSCLYDGKDIVQNTPALGYILGDEGGGAVLGRMFMNAIFKNPAFASIRDEFLAETKLTQADIIQKVYREPLANRFLATTSLFIVERQNNRLLRDLVIENFREFFRKNIVPYKRPDLPVHFVGSMAHHYPAALQEAAEAEGFHVMSIVQSPIDGLMAYHSGKTA